MLTHSITPYTHPVSRKALKQQHHQQPKKGKFQGTSGSGEHKEFIFNRAKLSHSFDVGDHVTFKRNPVQIVAIYEDYGPHVEWDGLCPMFVEIFDGNPKGDVVLVHPSQLRRKR